MNQHIEVSMVGYGITHRHLSTELTSFGGKRGPKIHLIVILVPISRQSLIVPFYSVCLPPISSILMEAGVLYSARRLSIDPVYTLVRDQLQIPRM